MISFQAENAVFCDSKLSLFRFCRCLSENKLQLDDVKG